MFFDLGALYEKAAEMAERAVGVDPGTGYALTDLADDEDALVSLFSSPTTSMIAIQGTLHGCVLALRSVPSHRSGSVKSQVIPPYQPGCRSRWRSSIR